MAQINSKLFSRQWRWLKQRSLWLLKHSVQTSHNRILTCGCLVLLFYLPGWCIILGNAFVQGGSTPLLNMGFLYLGFDSLWRQRQKLVIVSANNPDRVMGRLLVLGCATFFPFCLTSISLQSLICMMIVIGMTFCCWGIEFFPQHPRAIVLLLIGLYPDLPFLTNTLRKLLTGDQLEHLMAWLGGLALAAIGQPVTVNGAILSLSTMTGVAKDVEVASGCSGFDMAFVLAGVGVIMGLFFNRSWSKVFALMTAGIALALLFNVPRIMLLAFAVFYWDDASFAFWHGPIGGQIFSSLLLTVYYYTAMGIIHRKWHKETA